MKDTQFASHTVPFFLMALLVVLPILVLLVLAASLLLEGGSASGQLESGRIVSIESDAVSLACNFDGDTARIVLGHQEIIVEPEQLIVDGRIVARIASTAKAVQISVRRGEVNFVVDGQPIKQTINERAE